MVYLSSKNVNDPEKVLNVLKIIFYVYLEHRILLSIHLYYIFDYQHRMRIRKYSFNNSKDISMSRIRSRSLT